MIHLISCFEFYKLKKKKGKKEIHITSWICIGDGKFIRSNRTSGALQEKPINVKITSKPQMDLCFSRSIIYTPASFASKNNIGRLLITRQNNRMHMYTRCVGFEFQPSFTIYIYIYNFIGRIIYRFRIRMQRSIARCSDVCHTYSSSRLYSRYFAS